MVYYKINSKLIYDGRPRQEWKNGLRLSARPDRVVRPRYCLDDLHTSQGISLSLYALDDLQALIVEHKLKFITTKAPNSGYGK